MTPPVRIEGQRPDLGDVQQKILATPQGTEVNFVKLGVSDTQIPPVARFFQRTGFIQHANQGALFVRTDKLPPV